VVVGSLRSLALRPSMYFLRFNSELFFFFLYGGWRSTARRLPLCTPFYNFDGFLLVVVLLAVGGRTRSFLKFEVGLARYAELVRPLRGQLALLSKKKIPFWRLLDLHNYAWFRRIILYLHP